MKGPTSSGEIHVIVGPMFAGKTTALLRRVKSEAANGRYAPPSFFFKYIMIEQIYKLIDYDN